MKQMFLMKFKVYTTMNFQNVVFVNMTQCIKK